MTNKNQKKPPLFLLKLKSLLDSKAFAAFDYGAALLAIGYGLYSSNNFILGLGVIGLGLAYFKPAQKLEGAIRKKKS